MKRALGKLMTRTAKMAAKNGHSIPVDLPVGFRLDKQGELVLPRTPGECADLLYRTREARLAVQRQIEKLSKAEARLQDYFIETLPKSSSTGLAGSVARVQIELRTIPTVEDWPTLYAHVKRTGEFELLQRRLNEGAVRERWESGVKVAGVGTFNAKKVSCTKL